VKRADAAIEQASRLVYRRPAATSTQATTEGYTIESEVPGAPTLVSRTDSEVGREPHASQIRSAVQLLTTAVAELRDEVRGVGVAVRTLEVRHDRLRDIVQDHGSRLEELDAAVLNLTYLQSTVRALLVLGGLAAALQLLTLGAVAVLVVR
jgi:hypothetical protein